MKNETISFRVEEKMKNELEYLLAVNGLTKSEFFRLCIAKAIKDNRWEKIMECFNKDRNNIFETAWGTGKSHNSIKLIHYIMRNSVNDRTGFVIVEQ